MNSFVDKLLCRKHDEEESSGDELFDKDATNLSHVGEAVHQANPSWMRPSFWVTRDDIE